MEKDRQAKIIAIVALFIGVATLTLGFAAFSARLVIQSKATVTPDADLFKVLLSKETDNVVAGDVAAIGSGAIATISNDDVPTISGLKANFVNPGEKVVYEFYAVNTGDYDAYLNKIDFKNIDEMTINKKCVAGGDTTGSYVDNACESIRITVKMAEDDKACQTSTYRGHKLEKTKSEKIVVEIEYGTNGSRADGPFSVQFGDIVLNYSTVDTEEKSVPVCNDIIVAGKTCPRDLEGYDNIIDNDCNDILTRGDKVTFGTESFYVTKVDTANDKVYMLAEWNLNIEGSVNPAPGEANKQNSLCLGYNDENSKNRSSYTCSVSMAGVYNHRYWEDDIVEGVNDYPLNVWNAKNPYYATLKGYESYLKGLGYNSIDISLMSYEDVIANGCIYVPGSNPASHCRNAPEWFYNTSFFTITAIDCDRVYTVVSNGNLRQNTTIYNTHFGIRPYLSMDISDLQ